MRGTKTFLIGLFIIILDSTANSVRHTGPSAGNGPALPGIPLSRKAQLISNEEARSYATRSPGACRDLSAVVCDGLNQAQEEKKAEEAARDLARRYLKHSRTKFSKFTRMLANVSRLPHLFAKNYQDYLGFIESEIGDVSGAVESTRAKLLASVEEMPLPPAVKEQMRGVVSRIQVEVFPNPRDHESIRAFVERCGSAGLTPGGFAVPREEKIFVCPGSIVRAKALGPDALSYQLLHMIAHEMGHCIGCDRMASGSETRFGAQFAGFGQCLNSRFSGVTRQLHEISADSWGNTVLGREVRGKSPAEALRIVKAAVAPLCFAPADDHHPSGKFRISVLLAETEEVSLALGCAPQPNACEVKDSFLAAKL